MLTTLASFLAGLFSSSKMTDTAVDALRKFGNLDEMPMEAKAKFILDYIETTKHQSPARRLIALMLTTAYGLAILVWLISAGVGYGLNYMPLIEYAGATKVFMADVITNPFNIILGFYFVMNIVQKIGSGK